MCSAMVHLLLLGLGNGAVATFGFLAAGRERRRFHAGVNDPECDLFGQGAATSPDAGMELADASGSSPEESRKMQKAVPGMSTCRWCDGVDETEERARAVCLLIR